MLFINTVDHFANKKKIKTTVFVRLAYTPPPTNTFLLEQTSHHQPNNYTFLSEQINTSHQPNEKACI
jgi:hypothetical protein